MIKKAILIVAVFCGVVFSSAKKRNSELPTMGWSSWNTYHVNISDSLIKRQADALVSLGLDKAGYKYINIDDGYFGGRDAEGNLLIHSRRFPHGLKPVVDHIHSLGLKAGIYSDAGRNTCGFYYDKDTIAHGVGMYGHDRADADFFFKKLGFDFIKIDFCGGNGLGGEPVLDEKERYTAIRDAIRSTGRKNVRLNVCRWDYPGTWVRDVGSSWRISPDIRPRWNSVKNIIGQNLYLSAYAGNGAYNDMDMLEVGRGMTQEEDLTHFGMWCMMSSPLLIGKDLTSLDENTLSLLTNHWLLSLNQSELMQQAYVVSRKDGGYILVKDLEEANGHVRAVAFYNSSDKPLDMTLYFGEIELAGNVMAFDMVAGVETGRFTDCMNVEVPPHATRIYRLAADKRLQRRRYEAETAYIGCYQELKNPIGHGTGFYAEDDDCSGGAKAVNLGGSPDNDLVWNNVYITVPGKYTLGVKAMTDKRAGIDIEVNGKEQGSLSFNTDGTLSQTVKLKKGYNSIRLYNDTASMPDIDCITLIPEDEVKCCPLGFGRLTVEGRTNYLGCDNPCPRFGWQLTSDENNQTQKAYRVIVASGPDKINAAEGDMWDSGKIDSDVSQWLAYDGLPLQPDHDYYFRVKVWNDNSESPWSPVARWSTGLMDPDGSDAQWIGLDTVQDGDSQQRHSRLRARYLRKEFNTDKEISKATVHISGLGFYQLDINGIKVGEDVLTPAPTDYRKSVIYNTYDVKSLLGKDNAIGVTLAPGYFYAMAQNYQTNVRTTYGFPKLWMKLCVEYADGSKENIVSDSSWKLTTDGPLLYSNIYDGEFYDSRKEMPGWNKPGYDDSSWSFARNVEAPGGKLIGNLTPAMCVYGVEKPKTIIRTRHGWLVDFGTNNAGKIHLRDKGVKGDSIVIRHAEMTAPGDTALYVGNLRSAECTDVYVSDGMGKEWSPQFTWQGFRYVELSPHEAVDTASIRRHLIADRMDGSDMDIEFFSADPMLGKILENARRGIMSNYKGMPLDCPQRDERMPWLGDRTTGALGESYVVNNHSLYDKWIKDLCESQRNDGAISDVAPAYWRLYNHNITWPAALPMVCDMLYKQYGDISPMSRSYQAIHKWLGYVKGKSMKDGVLTYDRYGDWCMPPSSPKQIHSDDPAKITDGSLIASCYYYYLCKMMHDYGKILGEDELVDYYSKETDNIMKKINSRFLNGDFYSNSTVTANLLPLAMGIAPDSLKAMIHDKMLSKINHEYDSHLACGVIGIQWLMRYLADTGNNETAWKIATTDSYPGWGYMVKQGATTIWELWNGDTANPDMNSANHVMLLGDLLPWCYEKLAGIAPDFEDPGFKRIIMKPDFNVAGLDGVKASHRSPYGVIKSEWHKNDDGRVRWEISVPVNCHAVLFLPEGEMKEVGSGNWDFEL
jgi:alpha-L-rhamnosidase